MPVAISLCQSIGDVAASRSTNEVSLSSTAIASDRVAGVVTGFIEAPQKRAKQDQSSFALFRDNFPTHNQYHDLYR